MMLIKLRKYNLKGYSISKAFGHFWFANVIKTVKDRFCVSGAIRCRMVGHAVTV